MKEKEDVFIPDHGKIMKEREDFSQLLYENARREGFHQCATKIMRIVNRYHQDLPDVFIDEFLDCIK